MNASRTRKFLRYLNASVLLLALGLVINTSLNYAHGEAVFYHNQHIGLIALSSGMLVMSIGNFMSNIKLKYSFLGLGIVAVGCAFAFAL